MVLNKIVTYENYRHLYTSREITKSDIVNICNELKNEFSGKQEFEPEKITEGGILFKSYNGEEESFGRKGPYKSIRFIGNSLWKTVDDSWKIGNMEVVIDKHTKIDLFLKAFDEAPSWKISEKNIFKKVLLNNGFTTKKNFLLD